MWQPAWPNPVSTPISWQRKSEAAGCVSVQAEASASSWPAAKEHLTGEGLLLSFKTSVLIGVQSAFAVIQEYRNAQLSGSPA